MSFEATLALKDRSAAVVNFLRVKGDTERVTYISANSTVGLPNQLMIAHQIATSPTGVDRHLVKLSKTVLDSNSKQQTLVLNCTFSVPRLGITRNDIDDVIAELKEFLTTARVDALLRGEL